MKKNYSEPDILFESFSLSTSIAAGCEAIPNTNMDGCGIEFAPGLRIFENGTTDNCNRFPGVGSKYDQYCYHTFDEELNIFFS